ncbi:hypothetical protein [Rhizobium binxianense]|uniref:hypothetical protein n=1 Tax=Rhizobium binxianense TaxID=3024242 RepID=UPI00235F3482|nr:hypothetical protein [Rhizobium sp. MC62]MDC9813471.1 hypothetical protein [Rhizobium sp. MC62]
MIDATDERFELKKKLYAELDSYPRLKTLFTGRPGAWKQQVLPDRIARSLPAYSYVADVESGGNEADYVIGSDGLVTKGQSASRFCRHLVHCRPREEFQGRRLLARRTDPCNRHRTVPVRWPFCKAIRAQGEDALCPLRAAAERDLRSKR